MPSTVKGSTGRCRGKAAAGCLTAGLVAIRVAVPAMAAEDFAKRNGPLANTIDVISADGKFAHETLLLEVKKPAEAQKTRRLIGNEGLGI